MRLKWKKIDIYRYVFGRRFVQVTVKSTVGLSLIYWVDQGEAFQNKCLDPEFHVAPDTGLTGTWSNVNPSKWHFLKKSYEWIKKKTRVSLLSLMMPAGELITLDLPDLQSTQLAQSLGQCRYVSYHCPRSYMTWKHCCIIAVDSCSGVLVCKFCLAAGTTAILKTAV